MSGISVLTSRINYINLIRIVKHHQNTLPSELPSETQPSEPPSETQPSELPSETQPSELPSETQPSELPSETQSHAEHSHRRFIVL